MKRFLRGFIFAFIAILSFTLISCGNEETTHEHTPSAVWSRDSASHWHACEVEGCDELLEFSLHTLSDWTKIDGECKEKRECTVCGFATTREIAHEFVDGLCVGCGLEEGNYEVEQFYVRGEHNGWGSPEEHALVYDPKTKTASIQITLEEGKKFKVADASWSEGRNFGAANCIYEAGLFEGTDDIVVLTTADYIITVSGYDTGEYSVEIKIACKHEFGTATPVEGKKCEFTEKCSLCGVVNQYTKHTFTDADIICDVCGHADLKVYYVKGSFNGFAVNEEFALEYDETTHTATVDLWLQVGHSFKIGTATGTDEEQWRFNYDTVTFGAKAKDAFIPDNDRNIYCVAKGADALGVKFTVTITGLNTLNHTMTIDTQEEYSVESVSLPTSSGIFVLGTMNAWGPSDSYGLTANNGKSTITLTLNAGDEFKVAKSDWSTEFNFNNATFEAGLFTAGGEYGNNLVVVTAGTYTIVVSGTTCTIVAGENADDVEIPTVDPIDETALYLKGSMNGWVPKNDYKFTTTGTTSILEVELAAGDEFKITIGSSWDDDKQWHFYNITTGANLFTAATENPERPNIVVKAAGTYLFTVNGTSVSVTVVTDEPTQEPDVPTVNPDEPTQEPDVPTVNPDEPTQEPDVPTVNPDEPTQEPDVPTVNPDEPTQEPTIQKSDFYLLSDDIGWISNEDYALLIGNGEFYINVKLSAGDQFKIRKGETWGVEDYGYSDGLNSNFFTAGGSGNVKVLISALYKITVKDSALTIAKIGEYECVSGSNHIMVAASCEVAKHCSVTGCGYREGEALGHTWDAGVVSGSIKTYTCTRQGCSETKEEAVEGFVIYFKPNANWRADNARFAVYLFNNGGTKILWLDMKDSDNDGIYEVILTEEQKSTYTNIIFCRMNPGTSANNWDNKWNQTSDLKVQSVSEKMYTINEGTWDKGAGSWGAKK